MLLNTRSTILQWNIMSTWDKREMPCCSYFRKFSIQYKREGVRFLLERSNYFGRLVRLFLMESQSPEKRNQRCMDGTVSWKSGVYYSVTLLKFYWMSLQFVQSLVISRRSGIASLYLFLSFFHSKDGREEGIEQLNLHTWVCVCVCGIGSFRQTALPGTNTPQTLRLQSVLKEWQYRQ